MNQNVPFVWRKNYQNEVGSNEELLETAHEKARQYLSRAAEAATRSTTYTMPLLQREIGHAKEWHRLESAVSSAARPPLLPIPSFICKPARAAVERRRLWN